MKCLLCDLQNDNDEELKNHYIYFHFINKNNYFFKELFSIKTENKYARRCEECKITFNSCREKNYYYLLHYQQSAGSNNLFLNISKWSVITYFSINYFFHKNSYNFYDAKKKTVNDFIFCVESKFVSNGKVNVQGPIELINYEPAETDEIIELESKRIG